MSSLTELLDSLKLKDGVCMTARSLRLLHLPPTEHEAFASAHKDTPLKRQVYLLDLPDLSFWVDLSPTTRTSATECHKNLVSFFANLTIVVSTYVAALAANNVLKISNMLQTYLHNTFPSSCMGHFSTHNGMSIEENSSVFSLIRMH